MVARAPERLGRILYNFHFIGYAKPKILVEYGFRSLQAFVSILNESMHIKRLQTTKERQNVTL